MQYIQMSKNSITALKNQLRQATYEPICACQSGKIGMYISYDHSLKNPLPSVALKSSIDYHKYALFLFGAMTLLIPSKSENLTAMEKVVMTKTLTVATTSDATFMSGQHRHGFGYDVVARYADALGATLELKTYNTAQQASAALDLGEVEILLDNHAKPNKDASYVDIGCNASQMESFGLKDTALTLKTDNTDLLRHTKTYLCNPTTLSETLAMAKFYQTNLLNDYSINHFEQALSQRLPQYKTAIKKAATQYGHDWQLLAAIGYQESHLNPVATSPTGVQGVMMLTRDTAEQMGVTDRTNAYQSIQGGAKYLQHLKEEFSYIPLSDRLWFVLAAYNMGPNSVKSIQEDIADSGDNPNLWSNFYTYLSDNADTNSRYVQCMHYVTNIRTYFERLKTDPKMT